MLIAAKALEEELEAGLIKRSSSGMALIAAGKPLMGEAKKLLLAATKFLGGTIVDRPRGTRH